MNTNKKGDIGLAKVILDITKKGFFLFLPFSDTTHVDLVIADDNMKLYRVQVKYISVNKSGAIEIVTSSVVNGKRVAVDLSKTDIWAVYCPDTDEIYYVSTMELMTKKSMNLRINKSKRTHYNIRYANDYLDIENAIKNIAGYRNGILPVS